MRLCVTNPRHFSSSLPSQRRLRDFISPRPPAFSYSVSILDLDPKPLDSIPSQLRLDQKIVSCYLRTGGSLPKGSLPPLPDIFAAAEREDCTLLFHSMWAVRPDDDDWRCADASNAGNKSHSRPELLLCVLVPAAAPQLKRLLQDITTKSPDVYLTTRHFCYLL